MLTTLTKTVAPDPYQGMVPQEKTFKKIFTTAAYLGEKHIPAFYKLQQKVWDALPDHEKHFLKLRSRGDLKTHLEARMPIIGLKDKGGALIAQALISYPSYAEAVRNLEGYPIKKDSIATTAIVQSLAVDPARTGFKLGQMVLELAKDVARMTGHSQIFAKVADDNMASRESFRKCGFNAAATGLDPKLGYAVTYWKHSLNQGCSAASPGVAL